MKRWRNIIHKSRKQQKKKKIDQRSDFPMGRSGAKAYSNALMKRRIEPSTQPTSMSSAAELGTMNPNVSTPSPPSDGVAM